MNYFFPDIFLLHLLPIWVSVHTFTQLPFLLVYKDVTDWAAVQAAVQVYLCIPVWFWLPLKHFLEPHLIFQRSQDVCAWAHGGPQGRGQTGADACAHIVVYVGMWMRACGDRLLTFATCCCPGIALATAPPSWHPFIEVILFPSHSAALIFQLSGEQNPLQTGGGLGFFKPWTAVSVALHLLSPVQHNTSSCLFKYITMY